MQITRIKNDINGNPRKVVHFLEFIKDEDKQTAEGKKRNILELFALAVKRANKLGGRRYLANSYGGGIVFQSYCDEELRGIVARARELKP
jgi:hypothetical protein